MKIGFKILGILIILTIGVGFLFYGKANFFMANAEKAHKYGDFQAAEILYGKGMTSLKKLPLFRIRSLHKEIDDIVLTCAWVLYCDGYYNPEKYELAEQLVDKELAKDKQAFKDQLYNLKALICWQKGVELFIKLGKKAAYSQEIDKLLDGAKNNSGEAIKNSSGNDWDIKYNYEFFRKSKEELKQKMQQQANSKKEDREKKDKIKQTNEEKGVKSNQQEGKKQSKGQENAKESKNKKGKNSDDQIKGFVPTESKNAKDPSSGNTNTGKKKG